MREEGVSRRLRSVLRSRSRSSITLLSQLICSLEKKLQGTCLLEARYRAGVFQASRILGRVWDLLDTPAEGRPPCRPSQSAVKEEKEERGPRVTRRELHSSQSRRQTCQRRKRKRSPTRRRSAQTTSLLSRRGLSHAATAYVTAQLAILPPGVLKAPALPTPRGSNTLALRLLPVNRRSFSSAALSLHGPRQASTLPAGSASPFTSTSHSKESGCLRTRT